MKLRCPRAPRGAQARLVFRAPYVRVFSLRNGTAPVRVSLDKPPGNVRPLGDLTTRPRDTNCKATPTGSHVSTHQFTASARVECHGLPVHAKGAVAVGGLLAAGGIAMTPSTMATATTAAAPGCREPSKLTFGGHTIEWRDCFGHPYTLGPWQSMYFGVAPPPLCPAGWTLGNGPIGGIARNLFPPYLHTEPESAWYWSNILGVRDELAVQRRHHLSVGRSLLPGGRVGGIVQTHWRRARVAAVLACRGGSTGTARPATECW